MDRCEKKLVIVRMRNVKFFHMFHLRLKIKVQKVKKNSFFLKFWWQLINFISTAAMFMNWYSTDFDVFN